MNTHFPAISVCGALLALFFAVPACGQEPASSLEIKSIAEVESKVAQQAGTAADAGKAGGTGNAGDAGPASTGGRAAVELVPADRVVPGDRVIYTLEVRNTAATGLDAPSFTYPIPEHMRYIANSAVGPGAQVSYSVDGGHSFARAEDLKVQGADGKLRAAVAADYTDIRWQLKNSLKANSVAFVRFRTLVK
jgi:uncharacterized repeat protein (TIGR01451 family)